MEEELNLDNILGAEEIENLFVDNEETQDETSPEEKSSQIEDEQSDKEPTTEVDVNSLFTDKPESVGSDEDDIEEQEGTKSVKDKGTSPNNYFYSSIAKALKEDGIFPDLEDDEANRVKSPEDFAKIIEQQIQSRFDARQKRIDAALNADVEVSEIRKYEGTMQYLNAIQNSHLEDESDRGEALRKQLIYQDFINRGYSKERAQREIKKSFDAGSDIEDAKEALASVKEFCKSTYNALISQAQEETNQYVKERENVAAQLKKSILEDTNVFGELLIDKPTRQKIYDSISKPVYRDPNTGEMYTAIQKYEMDNHIDFMKNLGLVFTLTNGFKNLDGLVKGKVRKEIKKGLRELESTLNNTVRTSDGNLKFVSGVSEDPESFIGRGWDLDV